MPSIVDEDDLMDMRQDEGERGPVPSSAAGDVSPAFSLLTTDARGNLLAASVPIQSKAHDSAESTKEAHTDIRRELPILLRARGTGVAKGDLMVQRIASGAMLSRKCVTALARKDGSIDVVDAHGNGEHLLTLHNTDMKKGIHRWVGLAVAHDGIFACTSAGDMRFFPVTEAHAGQGSTSSASTTLPNFEHDASRIGRRELPEPLQHVAFEPESDPKQFAFGGEEIPLSVWDARLAFAPAQRAGSHHEDGDANGAHKENNDHSTSIESSPLSNKQRKRKRAAENRAKAAELMWGEVWRAKNLPNDALSLPQRANVMSIAGLRHGKWAVGTKTGHVRIYDTTLQRKHTNEFRVFDVPIKHLVSSFSGSELIASDTNGRIFVADVRSGAVLYQYKGITGAITALLPLPPAKSEPLGKPSDAPISYLATASSDRMLRLHSVPLPSEEEIKDDTPRKMTKRKGAVLTSIFMREGIATLTWDGIVPLWRDDGGVSGLNGHDGTTSRPLKNGQHRLDVDTDDSDDDDEVWNELTTVEEKRRPQPHATGSEDQDDDAAVETRTKRKR